MVDMLKRHAIQVLRQTGHDQADVARLVGVGVRTVRRVDGEPDVTHDRPLACTAVYRTATSSPPHYRFLRDALTEAAAWPSAWPSASSAPR